MGECAAFWVAEPGLGEIRAERISDPAEGQVKIRTSCSGISRGTESLVFKGRVPESEYERMRCPHQAGSFPGPVKYGYASVGVVDALGLGVGEGWLSERVFCLHPHQDQFCVAVDDLVPVPASVPEDRAVLAANLETAVNTLWDAAPLVGDRIAIVGAGTMGCLVAGLAGQIPGVRVELVDVNPARADIAARLGVAFSEPDAATGEVDLVFHASGRGAGLALSLSLAGFEARIVELSWYGADEVTLPLGGAFHSKRLSIVASQVGQVAPARRSRRSRKERLQLAMSLLADPRYDCLLSEACAFDELPKVMGELASGRRDALCQLVRYT